MLVQSVHGIPRSAEPPAVMVRQRCPVDEIEAGATDLCVQQLPQHLRETIVIAYLSSGTADAKATTFNCSRATYYRRLEAAYIELLGLMNDYEVGLVRSQASPIEGPPAVCCLTR